MLRASSIGDGAPLVAPARISLFRYSPAIVLLAIVIADFRQLSDSDLWGHLKFGGDLIANGSWPANNVYSYSAPDFRWLHHEWLSEVLMATLFGKLGVAGLKIFKFACSAGIISFLVLAEAETGALAISATVALFATAIMLVPSMQFRPQLFDFMLFSAIIALLARHNYRGAAPLWIVVPIVALWSNLHGGFFIGLVAIGVYGGALSLSDYFAGRGLARGLTVLAISALAALSTLCTFLIPPARDTWHALIYSLMNPMTRNTIQDWRPLIDSFITSPAGSIGRKFFIFVMLVFAIESVIILMTPRRGDFPLIAVAAVMIAASFMSVRNIPFAICALTPVFARHLGPLPSPRIQALVKGDTPISRGFWLATQLVIVVIALMFARATGVLSRTIGSAGSPQGALDFLNRNRLKGNVLADFGWGNYILWHAAPGTRVFIDSRYDLGYPPKVVSDFLEFDAGRPAGAKTLLNYPHDYVLIQSNSASKELMKSQSDWILIYSDKVGLLYARRGSAATRILGLPITANSPPADFP